MATVSDNRSAAPAGSLADCAWERNTSFDLAPPGSATRSSIGRARPRSRGSEDAQRSASALVRACAGISLRTSADTRAFGKSTSRMASRAEVCEMTLIMVGRMVDARAGSVSSRIFPLSCGWLPGIERVALQWVTNSRYSDLGCDVSSFRGRHNAGESPIEHPQSSPFAAELRRSSGSLEPGWAAMLPLARICRFFERVYRQLAGKWGDRTFTWRLKARGRPVFVRRRLPVRAKLSGSSPAFPCCAQKPRFPAPSCTTTRRNPCLQIQVAPWCTETSASSSVARRNLNVQPCVAPPPRRNPDFQPCVALRRAESPMPSSKTVPSAQNTQRPALRRSWKQGILRGARFNDSDSAAPRILVSA